jgi:hypothetical protein
MPFAAKHAHRPSEFTDLIDRVGARMGAGGLSEARNSSGTQALVCVEPGQLTSTAALPTLQARRRLPSNGPGGNPSGSE